MSSKLRTRLTISPRGHTLSTNATGTGGGVDEGPKSAVTMYCLNAVGRGEGVKKGPKIAVILKVSPLITYAL